MTKVDIYCEDCNGTGLYRGTAERDKSAVVCCTCGGSGCVEFEYEEFKGRRLRNDVSRVYRPSLYVITHKDITTEDGKTFHFSRYGVAYKDWLEGAEPKPMEELECPYMTFNEGIGNEPLDRCRDEENEGRWGDIEDCTHFDDKAECWKRYWGKNNAT